MGAQRRYIGLGPASSEWISVGRWSPEHDLVLPFFLNLIFFHSLFCATVPPSPNERGSGDIGPTLRPSNTQELFQFFLAPFHNGYIAPRAF